MNWPIFMDISAGIGWSAAYIFMIIRAIKDKKVATPIWAVALNLTWETFYFFAYLGNYVATYVRGSWMILDFVLFCLLLKYNRQYFPDYLKKFFYPLVGLAFATCLAMQFAFYYGSDRGITYAAWVDNVIISILFLTSLLQATNKGPKEALRGHDIYAAICKLIGTACYAFYYGIFANGGTVVLIDPFVLIVAILNLIFDILYIIAIGVEMSKLKKEKDFDNEEIEEKS